MSRNRTNFSIRYLLLFVWAFSTFSPLHLPPVIAQSSSALQPIAAEYRQDAVLVGIYAEALNLAQADSATTAAPQQALERELGLGSLRALFNTRLPQQPAALQAFAGAQRQLAFEAEAATIFELSLTAGTTVESALQTLRANPAVAFAEPDYIARAASVPNDPRLGEQWGLSKIQAAAAWDTTTGSTETIIAVIDSGIKANHEDLATQLWTNPNEIAGNGIDDDHNGFVDDVNGANIITKGGVIADSTGHGTQVAGVIAAAANNGVGVAGVCWNCRLMMVKVISSSGTANYSDITTGINYAVKMGAKVINLSLGGYSDSATLKAAIQAASQTAVVVAGAGNDNLSTPFYPAAYTDSVLAVAGTAPDDTKHSGSNYGSWVSVSAPGENILTTDFGGTYYMPASGTSLAAPFVSGLAGLLISQHPGWSPTLVSQQIRHTAESIDGLNPTLAGKLGSGRLNAFKAVSIVPKPNFSIQDYTAGGRLSGSIKADGNEASLWLTLKNDWLGVTQAAAALSSSSADVKIIKGSATFTAAANGLSLENSAEAFKVSVTSGKYGIDLPLRLVLTAAGATQTLDFSVQSESQSVTISSDISSPNEHWVNTRTYLVSKTVTVKNGAGLTIDPGTQIMVNANALLKIDGTLIADGSAASPIVFTSSTAGQPWEGISFTGNAAPATFDDSGAYLGGSILRYSEVSNAKTGVTLQTNAPYFANDLFQQNGYGISLAAASSARIEDSIFMDNTSSGIGVSGGMPLIKNNVFKGNGSGVGPAATSTASTPNSSILQNNRFDMNTIAINMNNAVSGNGGTPQIIGNTITNQSGPMYSIFVTGAPFIYGNRITGNTGQGATLYGGSLSGIDIRHNLIADNNTCFTSPCVSAAAVSLDLNGGINTPWMPAVTYNPDLNEFVVIWIEGLMIKGQRVSAAGDLIGPASTLTRESYFGYKPALAYNSQRQEYLLSYTQPSMQGIQAQRIGSTLLPSGAPVTVSSSGYGPKLVYQSGDQRYLVAWRGTPTGGSDGIYAQYLLGDGSLTGDKITLASTSSGVGFSTNSNGFELSYDPTNQRSLAVFSGTSSVCFSLLSPCVLATWLNSTTSPTLVKLAEDDFSNPANPALAYGSTANSYGLTWGSYDPANQHQITLGQNNYAATWQPVDMPIALNIFDSAMAVYPVPAIAYSTGAKKFLTIWNSVPDTNSSSLGALEGRFTLPDGSADDKPISISATHGMSNPALAYGSGSAGRFMVAWPDANTGRIAAQLLDESGGKVGGAINVSQNFIFANNTLIYNSGPGLSIGGAQSGMLKVVQNNLFGNKDYDISVYSGTKGKVIDAANNYWGAILPGEISGRIYDCEDDVPACNDSSATFGQVLYDPPLAGAAQSAPAFVTASGFDPQPVGINQKGTLTLDFSRPMDPAKLPNLTFFDSRRGTIDSLPGTTGAMSLARDPSGAIWFACNPTVTGTPWGLKRFDGQTWTTYSTANGLANDRIAALYITRSGNVWVIYPTDASSQAILSRFSGGSWKTFYRNELPNSLWMGNTFIGEDKTGRLWFGSGNSIYSFDGVVWKVFTVTENPLLATSINGIATDGQGRMWFVHTSPGTGVGSAGGLSMYDGSTWKTYTPGAGLPTDTDRFNSLYGDSKGRVWFTYNTSNPALVTAYLGVIEGDTWKYYKQGDAGYPFNTPYVGFADHPDGTLWIVGNNNMGAATTTAAIYDGKRFSTQATSVTVPFIFDLKGSLFMGAGFNSTARVVWGGVNYTFDTGSWHSTSQYQATYNFTARIPPGTYQIAAAGAYDTDAVEAYNGGIATFKVAYTGQVSETMPPAAPQVSATSKKGDAGYLKASWSVTDPNNQIDGYRYAIGTSQGASNILYWTTLNQALIERSGLALSEGQTYWVSVQAHNLIDWGASGSASFTAGLSDLKVFIPAISK